VNAILVPTYTEKLKNKTLYANTSIISVCVFQSLICTHVCLHVLAVPVTYNCSTLDRIQGNNKLPGSPHVKRRKFVLIVMTIAHFLIYYCPPLHN